jgi:hypothetical protein
MGAICTTVQTQHITHVVNDWLITQPGSKEEEDGLDTIIKMSLKQNNEVLLWELGCASKAIHCYNATTKRYVKENCLILLNNLTTTAKNQVPMFKDKNLMNIVKTEAKTGQEDAIGVLWGLALNTENQVPMFQDKEILNIGKTFGAKGSENALQLINAFSTHQENHIAMFHDAEIIKLAKTQGATGNACGIQILWSLCGNEENRVQLYKDKEIMAFAKKFGVLGDENALSLLAALANSQPNVEDMVVNHPDILDMALKYVKTKPSTVLTIIQNFSNNPKTVRVLDKPEIVHAISPYLLDKKDDIRLAATMILSNIVGKDKERSEMLTTNSSTLKYLVGLLNHVLTEPPEKEYAGGISWNLYEPLQPIRSLSLIDKNRTHLVAAGVLPLLTLSLSTAISKNDPQCTLYSVDALQQFTFDAPTLKILRADSKLSSAVDAVIAQTDSKWDDAKRSAQYLKSKLSGQLDQSASSSNLVLPPPSPSSANKTRVMMSYSWHNKDVGNRVDKYLIDHGVDVWRDLRDMTGNVVDSMMKGVLSSNVFMCIVSRDYIESANCRAEFEFAKNNKKRFLFLVVNPPSTYDFYKSWLGFHMGNALWYLVGDDGPTFASSMKDVVDKELSMDIVRMHAEAEDKVDESKDVSRVSIKTTSPVMLSSATASMAKSSRTVAMPNNSADIQKWLIDIGLAQLGSAFEREGITSAQDLMTLHASSAKDLIDVLGCEGKVILKLKAALSKFIMDS